MIDICIIGGGASGIIAAISARMENPHASICILEKSDKLGKKLLATGNGRCNFSNTSCKNSNEILNFFYELGIKSRVEEQGRIYPYSGQAQDVLNALVTYLITHDIKVNTNLPVSGLSVKTKSIDIVDSDGHLNIVNSDGYIDIISGSKKISAKAVLVATGGKAGPQFGCSGDGHKIARELGHTVTKTIPALSPVECKGNFEYLKGIRAKALVTLIKKSKPSDPDKDEKVIASEVGEVQFTEYGLSGICILNLSRNIIIGGDCGSNFEDYAISVDLLYDMSLKEVAQELSMRRNNPNISDNNLLISLVPKRLADFVLNRAGVSVAKVNEGDALLALVCDGQIKQIKHIFDDDQIERIAYTLKNLTFTVTNVKGWKFAQSTSGGISTDEIDMDTMESKIVKGVYFSGELIDYDGPCGGYNLNNAWETGIKAGMAMARKVTESNV